MTRKARCIGISSWMATSIWLATACTQSFSPEDDLGPLPPPPPGVGTEEWGAKDITCSDSSDCGEGESCIDNICQMQRCGEGPYNSIAPLGESLTLAVDREIVATDNQADNSAYFVDGYEVANGDVTALSSSSASFGSSQVKDVAGGNFYGESQEYFAAALESKTEIGIRQDGYTEWIDTGFQPVALDAGDVDRDGLEEILALGGDGRFALCKAPETSCRNWSWDGVIEGIDTAVADTDGDGYAEGVFAIKNDGQLQFVYWNPHFETTGEDEFKAYNISLGTSDYDFKSIAAGDLDGDGVAEVAGIHSRWGVSLGDDRVKIYRYTAGELKRIGDTAVSTKDSKDIAIGNLGMNDREDLIVLRDANTVEVWRSGEPGSLTRIIEGQTLSFTNDAGRIATADVKGDSPTVTRVSEPELISGPIVPIIAAEFPPYDAAQSGGGGVPGAGGGGVSDLFIGETERTEQSETDSVHVRAAVSVGVEGKLFGVLGASAKTRFSRQVEYSQSISKSKVIGTRYFALPNPDLYGSSYGVVVLSGGCFHRYTYRLSDPGSRISADADGSTVVGVVPVDGQNTLWSTPRYNALAEQIDYLPQIEVSTELGNPDSYPQTPERADGTPIPPEDMVFPNPPTFLVSDAGRAGWWLTVGETEGQSEAMTTEVGVMASLSAGVTVEGELTAGFGKAYSVSVGNEQIFSGKVPPIEDDPNTPEDEYEKYAFSYSPYVYRNNYTGPDGDEAGYYVLRYTVGEASSR